MYVPTSFPDFVTSHAFYAEQASDKYFQVVATILQHRLGNEWIPQYFKPIFWFWKGKDGNFDEGKGGLPDCILQCKERWQLFTEVQCTICTSWHLQPETYAYTYTELIVWYNTMLKETKLNTHFLSINTINVKIQYYVLGHCQSLIV